ncbi:MAG TPA: PaaI family thioesterase [Anaerolineae bacterium]|nr:PaaI family thioesterase [Anaerolineae bacterium]
MKKSSPPPDTRPLPDHGPCFVCGHSNPQSIGVTWFAQPDGRITATVIFTEAQQGPPGFAHGGASAAVLDEAMGAAIWSAGHTVVAVNLNVDYHRPVPLGQPVSVEARITGCDSRAMYTQAELRLPDGRVAVSARGIYVEAPHLFNEEAVRSWLGSHEARKPDQN